MFDNSHLEQSCSSASCSRSPLPISILLNATRSRSAQNLWAGLYHGMTAAIDLRLSKHAQLPSSDPTIEGIVCPLAASSARWAPPTQHLRPCPKNYCSMTSLQCTSRDRALVLRPLAPASKTPHCIGFCPFVARDEGALQKSYQTFFPATSFVQCTCFRHSALGIRTLATSHGSKFSSFISSRVFSLSELHESCGADSPNMQSAAQQSQLRCNIMHPPPKRSALSTK
jgi:hypothetical protein